MRSLRTDKGHAVFVRTKPLARTALVAVNEHRFSDANETVSHMRDLLITIRHGDESIEDNVLNDLYVLERYTDFFFSYAELWAKILDGKFSASWHSLQDALDFLRLVKRFSRIDVEFFETQLVELEKTYPYNVFFSIGATVERFECSLCGRDIDSYECPHMRGQLYKGQMAHAIARNIVKMNEVSMVTRPQDKRCVVEYDDAGEQFKLVRFLSQSIATERFRIADFGVLKFSKKMRPNPDYRKIGCNDLCVCGSGRKFKRCCISKEYVERDHVDIVAQPRRIEDAVA